jgi:hypothetical protein
VRLGGFLKKKYSSTRFQADEGSYKRSATYIHSGKAAALVVDILLLTPAECLFLNEDFFLLL